MWPRKGPFAPARRPCGRGGHDFRVPRTSLGRDSGGVVLLGGRSVVSAELRLTGEALTSAISAAMVQLYRASYGHDRTTATTYLNDNIVLCVLEDILTTAESRLVEFGNSQAVLAGRIAFQTDTEDEFTAAIENLTRRRVVAFLSANQTTPGCACELFFLDPAGEHGAVSTGDQP